MPISPFMDRKKSPMSSTIINCQIGFISVLVKPLLQVRPYVYGRMVLKKIYLLFSLQEWTQFLGETAERDIMVPLAHNTQLWETQGVAVVELFPPFLPSRNIARSPACYAKEARVSRSHPWSNAVIPSFGTTAPSILFN